MFAFHQRRGSGSRGRGSRVEPTTAPPAGSSSSFETDRDVLLHLYRTTCGGSWKYRGGWAENAHDPSSWYGVTTNEDGRVEKLELQGGYFGLRFEGNNLTGVIPPQLGRLTALTKLDLTGNKLSGEIPRDLGKLRALKHLMMPHNELSGTIPPELGRLVALQRLSLAGNYLTGRIPAELGELASLERLNLYANGLTGDIPPELGNLRSLQRLYLSENHLTGIPPELGKLQALRRLYLIRNQLSGTIPPELGKLSSLVVLDLSWNKLHGVIPPELGQLSSLHRLQLTGNRLSGRIPPELDQLYSMKGLHLNGNLLSGPIPSEFGKLKNLRTLALSDNELSGTIPKELCDTEELRILRIDNNKFTSLGEAKEALRLLTRLLQVELPALKNNPWVMPPEAVVEKGGAVHKYLLEVEEAAEAGAEVRTLKLLKVVLVGSSRAGKTSLVNSIISGRPSPTVGTAADVSTVGIDLIRHRLQGTTVEFYDCAGQVDYAGMQQTFLSRRALYLVVWDVRLCHGKDGKALDEVIFDNIMRWLYALHLRAPGSTVLLVANHCDSDQYDGWLDSAVATCATGGERFVRTATLVEKRVRELLKEWQGRRGVLGNGQPMRCRKMAAGVTVLPQASTVSCLSGFGLPELIDRVAAQGATSISVPPAWDLALKFIDSLRDGEDPLQAARAHLGLTSPRPSGPAVPAAAERDPDGIVLESDSESRSPFMKTSALFQRWMNIVSSVEGDLRSAAEKMAVRNPESALEAALWISEYSGQTLPVAYGNGIFLDVKWLSAALKPILSHKFEGQTFPQDLTRMRDEFVDNGVLRVKLAEELWCGEMGAPQIHEGVVEALCRVLIDLGVALPLDTANLLAPGPRSNSGRQDMLVIMRLSEMCTQRQQRRLEELLAKVRWSQSQGAWGERAHGGNDGEDAGQRQEVTLKWRFDLAGPPSGLVERLIASCRVIGKVEQGLCWRYGAVFHSHAMGDGNGKPSRLYTFVIRYDKSNGEESRVLTFTMFGPLRDWRVWAAIRWAASAVISVSREWRGVLWEGWPVCAEGHAERIYLATQDKANVGDLLLPDAAPTATPRACDCLNVEGGALRLALDRLGVVVDTQKGDPFARPPGFSVEEVGPSAEPARAWCGGCSLGEEVFRLWLPSQRDAGKTAGGFWTAALTLLGAAVTLKETDKTGWQICLGMMGLCLLVAALATVAACRYNIQKAREEERTRRQSGDPPRGAADVA
eukprot:g8047.t2